MLRVQRTFSFRRRSSWGAAFILPLIPFLLAFLVLLLLLLSLESLLAKRW